ncbi:hypothetical protein B0H14DRAFT_3769156 [Mycena olivaceomarginata]|nr:hypothetical protein B0H14DRAFT_3769156 [Mycena olivaceomarginata]
MISNGVHEFSVSLLKTAIGQEDDEDDQKTAVGLERAISKAAAGDLHKYRSIFRHIYLELKSQKVEVVVIGRGGLLGIFRLPRRSKMSRLRAIVEEIVDEHDPRARFFMRSPKWRVICDNATPYALCMGKRETIYYTGQGLPLELIVKFEQNTGHIVVVRTNTHKSTFGVASTYLLDSLRNFLPRENIALQTFIYIGKYKAGKNSAPGEHALLDLECRGSNPWVRGNNTQMQNSVTAEDFHFNLVPEDLECARAAIEAVEGVL